MSQDDDSKFAEVDLGGADVGIAAWDGSKGPQLEPHDAYHLLIEGAENDNSRNGQTQMVRLTIKVIAKLDPETLKPVDSQFTNKVIRESYSIIQTGNGASASIGRWKNLYQAVQLPWDGKIAPMKLVGREFLAAAEANKYQVTDQRTGLASDREGSRIVRERAMPGWSPPASASAPAGGRRGTVAAK